MKKLLILVQDSLVHSLRTRRAALFLALYAGVFFLLSYGFIRIQEKISLALAERGVDETSRTMVAGMVKGLVKKTGDSQAVDFFFAAPFLNIALFVATILGTPALIILSKYDLVARETDDGSFRYLTFRVSRIQILVSRLVSSVLEYGAISLFILTGATLWAKARIASFPLGPSLAAGLGFWLKSQFFLLIFICLAIAASVIVRRSFLALLLSFAVALIFLLLPFWTDYLSPFDPEYLRGLLYPLSPPLYLTLSAYLVFSAFFFTFAAAIFSRKNL